MIDAREHLCFSLEIINVSNLLCFALFGTLLAACWRAPLFIYLFILHIVAQRLLILVTMYCDHSNYVARLNCRLTKYLIMTKTPFAKEKC